MTAQTVLGYSTLDFFRWDDSPIFALLIGNCRKKNPFLLLYAQLIHLVHLDIAIPLQTAY